MRQKHLVLLLAGLCVLFGCGPSSSATPKADTTIIHNGGEYNEVLARLQKSTQEPLVKYVKGEPLAGKDLDALEKAEPEIRGLVAFNPQGFGPHVLLAQCLRAQGKIDEALTSFETAIIQAPENLGSDEKGIVANCFSEISSIHYQKRQLDMADKAIRDALLLRPESPVFLTAQARIQIELNQLDKAKENIAKAKKLDPNDPAVKQLEEFISKEPV